MLRPGGVRRAGTYLLELPVYRTMGSMGADWESVPDWLAAVGTTGGLIFIGFQYHRDRTRDLDERKRLRAAEAESERLHRDAEAAQARLVSFKEVTEHGDGLAWLITVHNDSDRPIRDVELQVFGPTEERLNHPGSTKGPGGRIFEPVNDVQVDGIEPGRERELRFDFGYSLTDYEEGDHTPDMECTWSVVFTDVAGLRWIKGGRTYRKATPPRRVFADS